MGGRSESGNVPTCGPAGPRRRSRAERRAQFLDVAAELIVEGGFDAVTMEGLAQRAGVSKGLGYAYFDNRDQLLAALFKREMTALDRRVTEAGDRAAAAGEPFEERLRAIISAGLDVVADRGALIGALLQGKLDVGPLEQSRRTRQRSVEDYFVSLVRAEYGLSERVARSAVPILLSGYAGALDLWVRRRATRAEITAAFVRLAVGGLRALGEVPEKAN